jgi:hypothetical protein
MMWLEAVALDGEAQHLVGRVQRVGRELMELDLEIDLWEASTRR